MQVRRRLKNVLFIKDFTGVEGGGRLGGGVSSDQTVGRECRDLTFLLAWSALDSMC